MSGDLKETRESSRQVPGGRVFHAKGMAGAKALRQTCRGKPHGWSTASHILGPRGAAQLQGKVREGSGQENSRCGGLRRETSAFCFSKYFTLSDPQNKAVKVRRVDFFFLVQLRTCSSRMSKVQPGSHRSILTREQKSVVRMTLSGQI